MPFEVFEAHEFGCEADGHVANATSPARSRKDEPDSVIRLAIRLDAF